MNTTLTTYAVIVFCYAGVVLATQAMVGAPVTSVLWEILGTIPAGVGVFMLVAWQGIIPLALALFLLRRFMTIPRVLFAGKILILHALFFLLFFTQKTSMPALSTFWADPVLADIDLFLHRVDPYVLTHAVLGWVPAGILNFIYSSCWFLPAFYLPVWIALLDPDDTRVRRFIVLHASVWVILGSGLALAMLSAGPVYYDALFEGGRFAGLTAALASSGITDSGVGYTQSHLWSNYINGVTSAGAGISAFPSVHVGMATVIALYIHERCPNWRWVSILTVLCFQILSVHLGWHYAIDGYASIVVVFAIWAALKRGARKSAAA